jgi:hypothetical protein
LSTGAKPRETRGRSASTTRTSRCCTLDTARSGGAHVYVVKQFLLYFKNERHTCARLGPRLHHELAPRVIALSLVLCAQLLWIPRITCPALTLGRDGGRGYRDIDYLAWHLFAHLHHEV